MATEAPAPAGAALLLADGRFPGGGHAHSGGLEAAVADGRVCDVASLGEFLAGRLATAGRTEAALAAAAAGVGDGAEATWRGLDAEAAARILSPALRHASRQLGRQLLRAGQAVWPGVALDTLTHTVPEGPHQPVALGAVAHAAGLAPASAASCVAYQSVMAPAGAAVRLLGLDPYAVTRLAADLSADIAAVAADAADNAAAQELHELPAACGVAVDLAAEVHATWEVRLFAS